VCGVFLDSREDVKWGRREAVEGCTAEWGNEGKWGKCDLKAGHGRPSSSAFDRT
jgi:hypothetical protein